MSKCNHYWNYDYSVYAGRNENECTIRRWCAECGIMQHAYTGRWYKSKTGEGEMWGEYPEGYQKKFVESEAKNER